ncbi:SemiSWEET family transporter [Chryseobacterium sp.]|uniref:SemiSWEET family transporter n=1 Tax=Chryseobacterium sp. TaxID=1871047 RepID=UPI0024E237EC|nr:SemiSWEET family transporter [Chryseobacterium sp.]
MNNHFYTILGWVATVTAVAMYVSYIPQISNNLKGNKGDWIQPLVAAINCSFWVTYGLLKKPKRDWPVAIANLPGIVFGLTAAITAL